MKFGRSWLSWCVGFVCLGASLGAGSSSDVEASSPEELPLQRFLRMVWTANELLQVRVLEAAITDEQLEAEKAIFDPAFVAQFDANDRQRPNTTEQTANLGFSAVFNERNRSYQGAFEVLAPRGGRFRLGYTLSELHNNLNSGTFANGEFVSTFGLTMTQPLWRGAGKTVTMAGIRAAAINSDIGFQDYRRGMMEVLGRAEIAYWDLYEAQEQYRFAIESLRLANELLTDSRKRLELGQGTQLSMMQAEAGVALREATKLEASRRMITGHSRLLTFLGGIERTNRFQVSDIPDYDSEESKFGALWESAYQGNPDFVALQKRAELDGLRVVVAKNAKLPQLDLTGGYGFSGIG
ncbi:MAG: TolC family protein, partial [Limisphaerales bacterium]